MSGLNLQHKSLFQPFLFDIALILSSSLMVFEQRLTFPFPFVHHQLHDRKVGQLLTVETRTLSSSYFHEELPLVWPFHPVFPEFLIVRSYLPSSSLVSLGIYWSSITYLKRNNGWWLKRELYNLIISLRDERWAQSCDWLILNNNV